MIKKFLVLFFLFGILDLTGCSTSQKQTTRLTGVITQSSKTYEEDRRLAQLYAPVFYFHPKEIYRPQPVEVILSTSRLRLSRLLWPAATLMLSPTPQDLFTLPSDANYFLDEWFGDDGRSEFINYTAHQARYQAGLSPQAGGPSPVVYAHVERDENPSYITIQYWVYYFYQDWFNQHEGDWEMVEVILSSTNQPEWVVLSQHHGGTRRPWTTAPVESDTHPIAYPALGSHANYFVGDAIYPNDKDVGTRRIEIMDRTGTFGRLMPDVIMIPDRAELVAHPAEWPGAGWIMFCGHWGEIGPQSDFSGPLGPADKGDQWEQPYKWGMNEPLDEDTWYKNRLRVEVLGAASGEADVQLLDDQGNKLPKSESFGNLAILHTDPPSKVIASIDVVSNNHRDVVVTWPNADARKIVRLYFNNIQYGKTGHALLELASGDKIPIGAGNIAETGYNLIPLGSGLGALALRLQGANPIPPNNLLIQPSAIETIEETWDAPDFMWVGDILPLESIGLGILVALLCSLVPTFVFISVLYWVDLYEKEPVAMLAAALMWGAIPAVVLALVLELFFRLPPNLIGPDALEAARLGLLAPVLEEVLKGAGLLYIFWRCRGEFDNVLDGLIFGAIIGFGFAMTTNFLSFLSNFMVYGYPGISASLVVTRTIHALDHGLYTAIFGASLGFARLAQKRRQHWILIAAGLALAIFTHTLHNLLSRSLVGLNALTLVVTCAGTLVLWAIAGWSLFAQRRCLQRELKGVVPESLYHAVLDPLASMQIQWRTLRVEGIRAWRQVRRLHHLCAELAFKREQAVLFPDEPERAVEVETMWKEISSMLAITGG